MLGQRFIFGPFLLDADRGTLLCEGEPLAVGHRGILLLTALIRRAGEALSKNELMDAGWSGTSVEESNLSVQVASLRKLLGPPSEGGQWIATIPRLGYRFVGAVDTAESSAGPLPDCVTSGASQREPSIAVLPFTNLGDDPEQEYFADGLTEDIIMGLSRLRWLLVCARNSSFTYKARTVNAVQVGHELGVSYVLTGSVRQSGQRVRISAQLVNASTASQIWVERYDGDLTDFFALQDQITESVVASIEPYLFAAEGFRSKRKTPESLDAWAFVMRAMPHIWTWTADDNETAVAYLKQATKIDPGYARANSLLAWMYAARLNIGWAPVAESREKALATARLAVEQDCEDAWAHLALGYVHSLSRRFEPAVQELTAALELNPSFAFGHAMLGMAYGYAGASNEGLQCVSLALRLSPRDPQRAPICQQWVSATLWRGGTRMLRTSSASVSVSGRISDRPGGPGRRRRACAEIARPRLRRWRKPSVSSLNCRLPGSSNIIRLSARLIARSTSTGCARRALNNRPCPIKRRTPRYDGIETQPRALLKSAINLRQPRPLP